jgi:hypothetical protein
VDNLAAAGTMLVISIVQGRDEDRPPPTFDSNLITFDDDTRTFDEED